MRPLRCRDSVAWRRGAGGAAAPVAEGTAERRQRADHRLLQAQRGFLQVEEARVVGEQDGEAKRRRHSCAVGLPRLCEREEVLEEALGVERRLDPHGEVQLLVADRLPRVWRTRRDDDRVAGAVVALPVAEAYAEAAGVDG